MAVERTRRRDQRRLAPVRVVGEVDDLHARVRRDDDLVLQRRGVDEDVETVGRGRPARIAAPADDDLGARVFERRGDRLCRAAGAEHERATLGGIDLRDDRKPVGGRPEHPVVADHEGVDRVCALCDLVDLVAESDDGLLVRDRHVRAGEARGDEPRDGVAEPFRRRRERHVRPVELEGRERGVLHRW